MAQTIDEIFNSMVDEANRLATLNNNADVQEMLTNTSKVAVWRLLFYVMAFIVWSLQNIIDAAKALVNAIISEQSAHTLKWYRKKALDFQNGFNLVADSDKFDNTGYTDDQIAASKIIKYAAVNETIVDGRRVLLLKIATLINGQLAPVTTLQLTAFTAYMESIKDAGITIVIYNRVADILRGEIDVYYNPLLLDDAGNRIDGGSGKPVEDAANGYLLLLPFNGEFSNAGFIDLIQQAYGVQDGNVFLKSMQRRTNLTDYQNVNNTFVPDAGYTRFDNNGLTINYIAHVPN